MKNKIYLFDIDGTLSDCEHRLHLIKEKPKDWGAFFRGIPHDAPITQTVEILLALSDGFAIGLFTGRPEYTFNDTELWLEKHGIPYDMIHMREATDRRPDTIVKLELANKIGVNYDVMGIFEDRWPVIQSLREFGYHVYDVEQKRYVDNEPII